MNELKMLGKTTLITGGASGIGREIALKLAENGSDIAILDMDEKRCPEVIKEIEGKYKKKGLFIPCDISDYELVKKSCDDAIKKFIKIDNIVCAAGYGSRVAIEDMEIPEWKKAVDINLNGTFFVIKSLVRHMLANKSGNIVIIGSATVETGSGGGLHYAATKTAQYGIMKGLSYELLSRGIRTNIITPHIIDTPMLRKRYPDNAETNAALAKRVPLGRIGRPQDIANVTLFLLSDDSGYICGANIIADGGAIHYLH
ncbi:MAG: SDR family oxidoreductase [Actinobacteria bacterium]|nr:SDR family oxidoreductase [Actinomycetota bacterium]